jgi:hypothetical protein
MTKNVVVYSSMDECSATKRKSGNGVKTAVEAYKHGMKEVIQYRRSVGQTEIGGLCPNPSAVLPVRRTIGYERRPTY